MRRLAIPLLATAALLSTLPARAQTSPGATVSGYAWADFVIGCTTCPHLPITLSGTPVLIDEDPLLATAAYTGTPVRTPEFADYTLSGGVSYRGLATFEGPLMTPLLKAEAATDNESAFIIVSPAVPVGLDLYQASVDATTLLLYQYTGSSAASYTFEFLVDGQIGNEQASVFASATLFGGPVLDLETGVLDFGYASVQGTGIADPLHPFAATFSVTATVQPGDSFWLLANLGILASMTYSSADVLVDAYDTMRVTAITGGDTALLSVVPVPVPEPAPVLLLAAGLAAVALRRRRRTD